MAVEIPFGWKDTLKLASGLQKDCNAQQDGTHPISTGFALLKKIKFRSNKIVEL